MQKHTIWTRIKDQSDYLISIDGDVMSLPKKVNSAHSKTGYRVTKQRVMKVQKDKNGYLILNIKCKPYKVHRLVAQHFIGESDLTVDHINCNKEDNRVENLRYMTQRDNRGRHKSKVVNPVHALNVDTGEVHNFKTLKEGAAFMNTDLGYFSKMARERKIFKGYSLGRGEII